MREYLKFYIDGQWVDPVEPRTPRRRQPHHRTGLRPDRHRLRGRRRQGGRRRHARRSPPGRRPAARSASRCCGSILAEYQKRAGDLADAVTEEMGAPASLAAGPQVGLGMGHLATAIDVLKNFNFEEQRGSTLVVKEPIGVCGLITPWNWPINQIAGKVFPALATGCTMVLKPSEVAPFSAQIFAEIMDAAGVPAGVFNLVYGDGPGCRGGAVQPSRHRHGVVHRLDARRHRGGQERRRRPSSASPRNWAARARTSCSTTTTSPRAWPRGPR